MLVRFEPYANPLSCFITTWYVYHQPNLGYGDRLNERFLCLWDSASGWSVIQIGF